MKVKLNKYLETITKDNCPDKCEFSSEKLKQTEIAKVPPPKEIWGIIISRDSTKAWWYFYDYSKKEDIGSRRELLFTSAIPLSLLTRISIFMEDKISKEDRELLFNIILTKTYWTHLHKCFTDSKKSPFKYNNAKACAEEWLKDELKKALGEKTSFIIALGNNVQTWVKRWKEDNKIDIEVINLLHPSSNNNGYWTRSKKANPDTIEKNEKYIERLIEICKEKE